MSGKMYWPALVLLALGALSPASAAPDRKELRTETYDVADLLHDPKTGKTGYDSAEAIIKEIVALVNPGGWGPDKDGLIQAINGTKLKVRATANQHADIKDLLKALRRISDVAVDLAADLYEIDREFFEKELRGKLGREGSGRALPAQITDAILKKIRARGNLLETSKLRIAKGREATAFSLREAFTYDIVPAKGKTHATGFFGVTLRARVNVTPDRRFVRMKLTQNVTELVGLKKKRLPDPLDGGFGVTVEVPELVDSASAATVEVEDGEPVLVPLHFAPKGTKEKGRVLVLVIEPTIYIEEEEKERNPMKPGAGDR